MNMNVKYFSRFSLNRVLSQLTSTFSRCVLYLFLWNWVATVHESELHNSREPNWQGHQVLCCEVHCCPRQGHACQESLLVSDWGWQGYHCSTAVPKGHTTLNADCPRPYIDLLKLLLQSNSLLSILFFASLRPTFPYSSHRSCCPS